MEVWGNAPARQQSHCGREGEEGTGCPKVSPWARRHPSGPGTKSLRQAFLTLDLDLVPDSAMTTVFTI